MADPGLPEARFIEQQAKAQGSRDDQNWQERDQREALEMQSGDRRKSQLEGSAIHEKKEVKPGLDSTICFLNTCFCVLW